MLPDVHHGRNRGASLALIAVLMILGFGFQGSRGIYAPDEGFYVSIAQSMLATRDFMVPRLHHEPWLDKPPLSMWGIAAGLRLFGQNELGARASHGLCFVLTALLLYFLGKSMYGRRAGLMGSVIYASMIIPFAAANVVTPDTPLALWTTAAMVCFWESTEPRARGVFLWKILMCAAFGLGFLTKGPAALVPGGAILLFLLLRRRLWSYFRGPWTIPGVAVFCALGLGWYVYVGLELSGALGYMLDNQVLGRIVSAKYERNPGPVGALIYVPVIVLGTLPWSILWWPALWRGRQRVFRTETWTGLGNDPARLFLGLWIAVSLVVLCLASSKLPRYVLPIFPALALGTARLWQPGEAGDETRPAPGFSRWATVALTFWLAALMGMKYVAAQYPFEKDMRALYAAVEKDLPNRPYEIVAVGEHLEGLGFYGAPFVERVSTSDRPYPFFVLPESWEEEVREVATSNYDHLFICKETRTARLRKALLEASIPFIDRALPFQYHLFVCTRPPGKSRTVRLVALGDVGKGRGKSRQYSMASALYRLYGDKSFTDGVILVGDNLYRGSEGPTDLASLARQEFEEPYEPLLKLGVPFYAALGNHDTDYGLEAFELQYPPFRMHGRRYYSQGFGEGLVELFVLDSNTLTDEDRPADPDQIRWLESALARSRAPWKIVVLHHPIHSSAMKYPSDQDMIDLLEPILVHGGVAIVLQGHNHLYERLAPIRGVHYITAGGGGTVRKNNLNPNAPERLAGNDQDLTFAMLEFDGEKCELTAFDVMKTVIDQATITIAP